MTPIRADAPAHHGAMHVRLYRQGHRAAMAGAESAGGDEFVAMKGKSKRND
jgi:hypothetical protein